MNYKKKAIEPIVATILLVVVAVILVTIVLAWGKNFTTGGLNEANNLTNDSCTGATIAISECNYDTNSGDTTFLLRNTSDTYSFDTDGFYCTVTDDSNASSYVIDTIVANTTLGPGATQSLNCDANLSGKARVSLSVRSTICPNTAISALSGCS